MYSSNKDWSVVNIWNIEQLKRKKSQIHRQLVQHLIDHNYDKGTLHELITIMQSPTKVKFCRLSKLLYNYVSKMLSNDHTARICYTVLLLCAMFTV